MSEKRDKLVNFRLTSTELAQLRSKAASAKMGLGEYIRTQTLHQTPVPSAAHKRITNQLDGLDDAIQTMRRALSGEGEV